MSEGFWEENNFILNKKLKINFFKYVSGIGKKLLYLKDLKRDRNLKYGFLCKIIFV